MLPPEKPHLMIEDRTYRTGAVMMGYKRWQGAEPGRYFSICIDSHPEPVPFLRGDSNADGTVNLADGVSTLGYLFNGNQAPPCLDAADTNDSGQIDIADAIGTFNWLFAGGAHPAPPGPTACGEDPTADNLICGAFAACP